MVYHMTVTWADAAPPRTFFLMLEAEYDDKAFADALRTARFMWPAARHITAVCTRKYKA